MAQNIKINSGKKITKKQLTEYKKYKTTKKLDSISSKFYIEAYQLENGNAFTDFETHGFLYSNVDELVNYLNYVVDNTKNETPSHYLKNIFPYDNVSFPKYVERLSNECIKLFKLQKSKYTFGSLKIIDSVINQEGENKIDKQQLYPVLLAYVGETIRNNFKNAVWTIDYIKGDDVWEPIITYYSKQVNPAFLVYEELFEELPETGEIAIYDHTQIEILQLGTQPN
jgi:hypothetical protein